MVQVTRRLLILFLVVLPIASSAQNPCAEPHQRALVMGGGGSKGAFQAGAVYHLVQHRGCDFTEISGVSVGTLNGAILAQAAMSADDEISIARLQTQAEALVVMWESIKSSKDVVKGRPLASLRFGLFGLESLKNFQPLHKLLEKNVLLERLEAGRNLRVGTVSFHDGRYHEIVVNGGGSVAPNAIEHMFGSAILPMFGTMPRIQVPGSDLPVQFGDGALRHTTPVNSYFQLCPGDALDKEPHCVSLDGSITPPHPRVEQLFVITTSPYQRAQQARPVLDQASFAPNTMQIRNGKRVMARALDLLMDSMYRSDLNTMYLTNDLLRWREKELQGVIEPEASVYFPIHSYNTDPAAPNASRPYELALIVPLQEEAEVTAMLDFSPSRISRQLYCGCIAADDMMQAQFGAESMASKCAVRFPPRQLKKGPSEPMSLVWDKDACRTLDTLKSVARGTSDTMRTSHPVGN